MTKLGDFFKKFCKAEKSDLAASKADESTEKCPPEKLERARLTVVDLEPRILLSATWVDVVDGPVELADHSTLIDELGANGAGQNFSDSLDPLQTLDYAGDLLAELLALSSSGESSSNNIVSSEPEVDSDLDGNELRGLTPADSTFSEEPVLSLVFVDWRVGEQSPELLRGISDSTIVVGSQESGLEAISRALDQYGEVRASAIHIISHGAEGALLLGNGEITAESLKLYEIELASWAEHLTSDADILIYGCDVASGAEGQHFIDTFSSLTGADVAASTNETGNVLLGRDWVLEYQVGEVTTDVVISVQTQQLWQGSLNSENRVFGEVGQATLTSAFSTIDLQYEYNDAVVILGPVSYNDGDNTTTVVNNVTGSTFDARLWEWEGFDGNHPAEQVGYMVVEEGAHTLDDGRKIEARKLVSDGTDATWMTVTFTNAFNAAPLVLSTAGSSNDGLVYTAQIRNVTTTGFQIRVRSSENDSLLIDVPEDLFWVAIDHGSGTSGGNPYQTGAFNSSTTTAEGVWVNTVLNGTTDISRVVLADLQTTNGGDAAELRYQNLTASSVQLIMEEAIDESHASETWGWAVFESGALSNTAPTDLSLSTTSLTENATVGSTVATVLVTDEVNDLHTFALTNDFGGAFAIDTNTGVITVADNASLDHELNATAQVTVRVTDGSGNQYSEQLEITLTDVNETPSIGAFPDGAVAAYSFEEGGGSWVPGGSDIVINAPVTLSSSASRSGSGTGLLFPVGDVTSAPNPVSLGAVPGVVDSQEFSFGAWVRFDAGSGNRSWERIFDFGNGQGQNNILLSRNSTTNTLTFEIYANGASQGKLNVANALTGIEGQWHHFASTLDSTGMARIYMDGQLIASNQYATLPNFSAWNKLYLGSSNWAVDKRFQGAMDDVVLYDRSISAVEVAALAAVGALDEFRVADNAASGTVVGSVTGQDPDASDTLSYSMIDNAGGRFAINSSTGVITVADSTRFDFEV